MKFCKECKNRIINDRFFLYDATNDYFCSRECLLEFGKKEKEKEDRTHLYETVCRIFHILEVPPRILGEIKRFKDKEEMSYKQIDATLHYMYDVQQMTPYGETIYKVPEYKEAAKSWYEKNNMRKNDVVTPIVKGRVVTPNYEQKKRQK